MTSPSQQRPSSSPALGACYARYGSDAALAQYCDAHYGPDKFKVPNFPAQLAQLCTVALMGKPKHRALDLGCAVGRASFELASHFDHVSGIDLSPRFIALAQRLQQRGRICYQLAEEGDLIADGQVCLRALGLAETADRVAFWQGNAQHLEAKFCDYDLILTANLIDRLSDPGAFLEGIHHRLVPCGVLAIASPYNWLEEFTPRQKWLGGRFHAGSPLSSLKGLRKRLDKHFSAVGEPREIEFVIRETARTFHHSISQVSFWRRVR